MIAKKMLALGKSDSAIRAIAAYGDARRSEIGSENVFDFSIGNPNVPTPEKVKNTPYRASPKRGEPSPARIHGSPRRNAGAQGRRGAGEQKSRI